MRFSTSPRASGFFEIRSLSEITRTIIGRESFRRNLGVNLILSRFEWLWCGEEDPVSCRAIRCTRAIAAMAIGTIKCREKNRFNVGWDTEKFPHIHWTRSFPTSGIAEKMLVITVAPQNDICPHGRTYPRKAVAMVSTIKMSPEAHTIGFLAGEPK